MSSSLPPASLPPEPAPDLRDPFEEASAGDVVLLSDASVEGEEIASALRARGFTVIDAPLSLVEARVVSEIPRVLIVDVDQPGAIERVSAARALRPEAFEVLCVGDPLRAAELSEVSLLESVFERPVDIPRLVDRVASFAMPAGPEYSSRGTTPPPMYAPRPSVVPAPDSVPPISELPRPDDPLELGAFIDPGEEAGMGAGLVLGLVPLSPELSSLITEAEERVRATLDRHSSAPAGADDDSLLPPEMLSLLDEPLDALEEQVGTGSEGTGGTGARGGSASGGTGGIGLSPAAMTPIPRVTTSSTGVEALEALEALSVAKSSTESGLTTSQEPPTRPPPPASRDTPGPMPAVQSAQAATSRRFPFESSRGSSGGTPPPSRVPSVVEPPITPGPNAILPPVIASPTLLGSDAILSEIAGETVRQREMAQSAQSLSPPVRFREPRDIAEGRVFDRHSVAPLAEVGEEQPLLIVPSAPLPPSATARDAGAFMPMSAVQPLSTSRGRSPAAQSVPGRRESSAVPLVFGEIEGLRPLARAIAARVTGGMTFSTNAGVRRVVLQEGDIVTAASEIADETLVGFLLSRGDLDRLAASRLAGKLPPSGRHAGAALIAQGHLAQDDLWPVLRAHADWLVGRTMISGPGSIDLEEEPAGRLKLEPGVFGGSTGAEEFVETARRVLIPQQSVAALGGEAARFDNGARGALLTECALSDDERAAALSAPGKTVGELMNEVPIEVVSVLRALVELDVLAVHAPARRAPQVPRGEPDPIDDDAVRARVRARSALVREGDYFALLGVGRSATSYEIKRAYLDLRRSLEPSRLLTAKTADLHEEVVLILEVVEEAYEILKEEPRRERYRRAIEAGPPAD
ncbi:MAG: hypothetical protein HOV80_32680 [Polyangiaceae bacterium]|nr:hypothetical protein [Polyangiaceae bacterium]